MRILTDMDKIKRIRGHAKIHADDGSWRIEHRDGSVEFASTPADALAMVAAVDERARRKAERKDPNAATVWVTTVEWHGVPDGFKAPARATP